MSSFKSLQTVLEMIKFEHTLFALPFAFLGMLLAAEGWPEWSGGRLDRPGDGRGAQRRHGLQPAGRSHDRCGQSPYLALERFQQGRSLQRS